MVSFFLGKIRRYDLSYLKVYFFLCFLINDEIKMNEEVYETVVS